MRNPLFAFDFDGVLADSLPIALEEFQAIIQDRFPSIPVPRCQEDMAVVFPGPLKSSLRRFGLSDPESKVFFDLHSAAMRSRFSEIALFPDVVDVIASCDPSRTAIVTSAYSDAVRGIFKRHGYCDLAETARIFGRELSLPKSEKFQMFADEFNRPVEDIIKIGDMVSDILYARSSGISIWSVGWGYHPIAYLDAFAPDAAIANRNDFHAKMKEYL